MIGLVVHGAAGRMGRRLVALAAAEPRLRLVGAVVRPGSALAGRDAGDLAGVGTLGLPLSEEVPAGDVLVDFSAPAAAPRALEACLRHRMGLLLGTTGLPPEVERAAREASARIPVVVAANTSLGVHLLAALVARASAVLGEAWDVEVVEAHHRLKRDAPSGTARLLVAEVARARGREGELEVVHGREGAVGERPRGQVGVHALRLGDVVGEHTVLFSAPGERLELVHRAHSRDTFAAGALRAAIWLAGRPPGSYTMRDVLGLDAKPRG